MTHPVTQAEASFPAEAFSELPTQVSPEDFPELAFFVILVCSRGQAEVGREDTFSVQPRKQGVPSSKAEAHLGRAECGSSEWGSGFGCQGASRPGGSGLVQRERNEVVGGRKGGKKRTPKAQE